MCKQYVTIDGVQYVRVDAKQEDANNQYQEKWNWLVGSVESANEQGTALYDDMKANGFSFGTAEAEGYLRGIRFVINEMKTIAETDLQAD